MNSSLSYYEGLRGSAPDEWLSQVLWAAGRAPVTGSYRVVYLTLSQGRYLYEPHMSLLAESQFTAVWLPFILSFDQDIDYDSGVAYMFATLASVLLWSGTESQLVSYPI